MTDHTTIARNVRADIADARDHGTLAIPPCVTPTVRVDRRGMMPSVNVYFTPVEPTAQGDVDRWKYDYTQAGGYVLSDPIKTASRTIIEMIKRRSDGDVCAQISGYGTIVAIITSPI